MSAVTDIFSTPKAPPPLVVPPAPKPPRPAPAPITVADTSASRRARRRARRLRGQGVKSLTFTPIGGQTLGRGTGGGTGRTGLA